MRRILIENDVDFVLKVERVRQNGASAGSDCNSADAEKL